MKEIVTVAAGVLLFFAAICTALILGSRHWGRISCENFSFQTGRPTKFVIYNAFAGGDCLTPSGKGTWIPTKNLREFGSAP